MHKEESRGRTRRDTSLRDQGLASHLAPSAQRDASRKLSICSNKGKGQNEGTFGLTGVDQTYAKSATKKMKEHNSAHLNQEDLRNKSMYDKSPFGLSIGRIDQKYEHWRTVRDRRLNKDREFENLLNEMKKKEKTREKNYNKFLKTEGNKKKTQFHKWSSRRQAAKNDVDRTLKDLEDTSYFTYRKEIKDLKKKEKEHSKSLFRKVTKEAADFIKDVSQKEMKRNMKSQERYEREVADSERSLNQINNKLLMVNNRLQDQIKGKIDDLNSKNNKIHDIKVRMNKYDEERKEKHFLEYLQKQGEFMKRMKKMKKENNKKLMSKHHKSLDVRAQVEHNKRNKDMEYEQFKDKVTSKHQKIFSNTAKSNKESEVSDKIHKDNQTRFRKHLKIRYQQQRAHERFKQSIINKHLDKMRHKELVQKKKEDLMEFSLLKQKEALFER